MTRFFVAHPRRVVGVFVIALAFSNTQTGWVLADEDGAALASESQPALSAKTDAKHPAPGKQHRLSEMDSQSASGFTIINWERSQKVAKGDKGVEETSCSRQLAFRPGVISTVHPVPQLDYATKIYEPQWLDTKARAMQTKIEEMVVSRPLRFEAASLNDVATAIQSTFDVDVVLDEKGLEGYDVAEPIFTKSFSGGTLASVLRQLLRSADLDYVVTQDGLLITARDATADHMFVVIYPIPVGFTNRAEVLVDAIVNFVQPSMWDVQGGPGACRWLLERNALIVSQTLEVHEETEEMLRRLDGFAGQTAPVAIYGARNPKVLADLEARLADICNAALGEDADSAAKVTALGSRLVVQSRSRPFHVYANEVIQAINGIDMPTFEWVSIDNKGSSIVRSDESDSLIGSDSLMWVSPAVQQNSAFGGEGGFGGGFCWVAREVYGAANPKWWRFRQWLLSDAPGWLVAVYATCGESFAAYVRERPLVTNIVRRAMDEAIESVTSRRPAPDGAAPPSRP